MRLSDLELIDLAWEAVREFFSPAAIEFSEIEVRHWQLADANSPDFEGETTATVWVIHQSRGEMFDPRATARANQRLWALLRARGDHRLVSLYHGFVSDARATKKAA